MIHRISGKPPVPESKFEKAQREARVTQPTTDAGRQLVVSLGAQPHDPDYDAVLAIEREARADRPPEPPTLDVERMARAMDRAVRAKGTRNPPGATAIAREYAALGASPPPPDLSQKVIDAAQVLIDDRGGTTGDHLRDLDDALREYRRFLASQPPSTPREP